jgi:putative ABC transport system permease protein
LIAAQIALTFAIIANAMFVIQQRLAESNRQTGVVDSELFAIGMQSAPGENNEFAQQQLDLQTLRSLPGVTAAAWINQMPLGQSGSNSGVFTERGQKEAVAVPATYNISDAIVPTLGVRLIEGRDFQTSDFITADPRTLREQPSFNGVIVSKALAKALYPDAASVIGKPLYWGSPESPPIPIIGVIDTLVTPWGSTDWGGDSNEGTHTFILPMRKHQPYNQYVVRTKTENRAQVMKDAEKALLANTAGRMVADMRDMDQMRTDRYRSENSMVVLLAAVVILLLATTAAGIIGMVSLWVNQRRKQIGVRRALGATRFEILRHFLTENFLITSMGVVAGALLSIGLNYVLVEKMDMLRLPALYIVIGAVLLWGLGLLAVYGPARRASLITPAIATRSA